MERFLPPSTRHGSLQLSEPARSGCSHCIGGLWCEATTMGRCRLGVALEARVMAAEYLASGALVEPFADLAPADDGSAYHLVTAPDRAVLPAVVALEAWLVAEAAGAAS